ncbi:MAG TPA: phosphoesterase [Lacipirellulaceae bacterium]|nr:phosphoesterase [Lacipirellulaceae bacterium]
MPAVAEEQVLVVPTRHFHALGHFQGFSAEVGRYLPALLEGDDLTYRPRGQMEQDPSFKQLIPYVVFRYRDASGADRLFQYTRGGGQGEARLHAKRSVGVGGHISTLDHAARQRNGGASGDVYREGLVRELDEEVRIETSYQESCVGLINDDETPVGQVHLGVVHLCDVDEPRVLPREADILNAGFRPVEEILAELEQFETWSQIVVRALFGASPAQPRPA